MDKKKMLFELLMVLKHLDELEVDVDNPRIGVSRDNVWSVIKEICNFQIDGPLNQKILEYVSETVAKIEMNHEDLYEPLIDYLLNSKIEIVEDF
ncbi:hypothetical protein IAQ67_16245 [Paenibacillus peoriae]|uniref:Uncharacterized protein n=1 Tax=Paenibacillus peoriae TaxID=59893 RepID=A0A7H0Y2Y6_9BACL|nr:hypothetical protein [Paenibacillus peoriae]QNR65444.1 hypothetical protein IAQ67_16245 [Paenibacillus peoriae]